MRRKNKVRLISPRVKASRLNMSTVSCINNDVPAETEIR